MTYPTLPLLATTSLRLISASMLCSSLLVACGGGGDSGSAAAVPATISSTPAFGDNATPPATPTPMVSSPAPAPGVPSPAPAPSAPSAAATNSCGLANFQTDLLARVNQARATGFVCGGVQFAATGAVQWNGVLFSAAKLHSQDMTARSFFDHTNPDGKRPGDRITAAGYAWSTFGENIAAGQGTVNAVMDSWLRSAGHCKNIMNPQLTEMGVACELKVNDPQRYGTYWTMVLARPR